MRRASTVLATVLLVAAAGGGAAQAAGRCGAHPWCDTALSPDARADLLLQALTRDEKISLLAGDDPFGVAGAEGTHTGTSTGVARVGLPTDLLQRRPGRACARARPPGCPRRSPLASTFDRSLGLLHGATIGNEAKSKGNDVVFAPTVNLMRTPLGGRSFESYGEDPYLMTRIGVEWIRGAPVRGRDRQRQALRRQQPGGRAARARSSGGSQGSRQTVNVVIDERTLREMYLPHFEAAVKEANVGSVMCSYNRVNGQYACENEHLLEDVLKGEWGFERLRAGRLRRGAQHGRVAEQRARLRALARAWRTRPRRSTPCSPGAWRPSRRSTSTSRRILRTLFAYGFFDRDAYPYDNDLIDKQGHADAAQQIAEAGIVLMKNDGVLPLDPGERQVGRGDRRRRGRASRRRRLVGGAAVLLQHAKAEIESRGAAAGMQVRYDTGEDQDQAAALAAASDVAVVFVADAASEGTDKPCMGLNCGSSDGVDRDALIERVRAANPRTVVVLETAAPVLTPWRGDVAALVEAWYPGVGGGKAIARVLFGDVNPSGRLPATFPRARGRRAVRRRPRGLPRRAASRWPTRRASSWATAGSTRRGSSPRSRSVTASPTRASATATCA